tara:strand:+ start:21760 stop:23610 length:1851 start_codon:yes stop_codon:yes gene_type:complete
MFVIYTLLLLVFVYLLPALAIFPRWILQPKFAALLPIVSAGCIFVLVTYLQYLHLYQTNIVIGVSLLLAGVAGFRMRMAILKYPNQWSLPAIKTYLFHILLLLPFFIKLSTHSFDRGDEIYSWNFWAIQHFLTLPIDFSHTGAAYPQLLPKLLSYCYQLLGNIQLQLPVKGLLILFSLSLLLTISNVINLKNTRLLLGYILGLVFVLFACNLSLFFDDGYADPLMSCGLVSSIWALWYFARWMRVCQRGGNQNHQKNTNAALFYLSLSVILAICAFWAKQPALVWVVALSFITLNALWQYKSASHTFRMSVIANLLILYFAVVWWFLAEGSTFHQNQGAMVLSFEGRGLAEQLWHATQTYLLHKPMLLTLFVCAYLSSRQNAYFSKVWWLFFVPSLLLWFMLAAYQLRPGQHLIALAWFIVVATQFSVLSKYLKRIKPLLTIGANGLIRYQKILSYSLMTVSITLSALLWCKIAFIEQKGLSFYDGGRLSLSRYFGQDSDWIYAHIYEKPEVKLWVPSRYIYGLFYASNRLYSPDYLKYPHYTKAALIEDLLFCRPDYVFVVSDAIVDGPASGILKKLVKEYPLAFELVANAPNRFDFETYKVNLAVLNQLNMKLT